MTTATDIDDFILSKTGTFDRMKLRDFTMELYYKFYSDTDISFMDEFLELAKRENEGKFIVHH